jgi:2-polyprenyl-6-methoxyphenol hydroxylase-like FAD-dependent oxidoreductase
MACALGRRGRPAVVYDRLAGPPDAGLALNLPGNAVRALGQLGLGDELARLGTPVRRREYRDERGRLSFAVDEEAFWSGSAGSRCVRRRDLLDLLRRGRPDGAVVWGDGVTAVRSAADGATVELASGATVPADLVVGADGVRSAVRAAVPGGGGVRSAVLSAASWRFMAPDPGVAGWTVWSGDRGAFLLIPVDDGEVYGFASATRGGPVGADPQWLREAFGDYPAPVPEVVEAVLARPASLYHSPIEEVHASRWSHDRVVLIGDAAHATAPVWAQGAAMAVEDAIVLADLLAERPDWTAVGPEYERRRRPRVEHVQRMTDRFSRAAGLPNWLRRPLIPYVGPRTWRAAYGPLRDAV